MTACSTVAMVDAQTADTLKVSSLSALDLKGWQHSDQLSWCPPLLLYHAQSRELTSMRPQAVNTFLGKSDGRDKLCATAQV